jgi:hypothetical protein
LGWGEWWAGPVFFIQWALKNSVTSQIMQSCCWIDSDWRTKEPMSCPWTPTKDEGIWFPQAAAILWSFPTQGNLHIPALLPATPYQSQSWFVAVG